MIEIFAVNVHTYIQPVLFERILNYLSFEKRQKVEKFVRFEDAIRAAVAEVLIKYIVMVKVGDVDSVFDKNEFGKPFLKDRLDFHFNISHSGKWVICAIDSTPIGIDIEEVLPIDLSIAAVFFTDEEYQEILDRTGDERLFYFYELWTLKESYLKAVGKGLFLPLNSFSIITHGKEIAIKSLVGLQNHHFKQYDIDRGYKIGVCANKSAFPKSVTMLSVDELCRGLGLL